MHRFLQMLNFPLSCIEIFFVHFLIDVLKEYVFHGKKKKSVRNAIEC